jgi:hypothetical protein
MSRRVHDATDEEDTVRRPLPDEEQERVVRLKHPGSVLPPHSLEYYSQKRSRRGLRAVLIHRHDAAMRGDVDAKRDPAIGDA